MSEGEMTEIFWIRHGETEWNTQGRLMNHLDSPLTELGQAQAEQVAVRLRRESFTALYSSDLGRAVTTAEAISRHTDQVIRPRSDLRELGMGIFQGLTWEEVGEQFPEHLVRFRSEFDYVVPEAESRLDFHARVVGCLESLATVHAGERIVAVTHGGTLAAALRHVLNLPVESPRYFRLLNGSINVFHKDGQGWHLRTWGDISHL